MQNPSQIAAQWVSDLSWPQIPNDVIQSTKLRILDITGTMLGGVATDLAAIVARSGRELFPGSHVGAVGMSERLSVAGAAFVNGTTSLILEFDDSHLESAIHVSSPMVAATLPVCQVLGASGHKMIESVLVGSELTCRLGNVAPGAFHRHGFHPTGIFGTFGAAYAVSKARSLSARKIVDAIGICGSLAAASMASWEDGTSAKSMHAGFAAASAVTAVTLAANGASGPEHIFDGRFNFFRAHVQDEDHDFDLARFGRALGEDWEVRAIASKMYPCGHYIQPHIEAALTLLAQHKIDVTDLEMVTCYVPSFVIPLVCEPVAEKRRPNTSFHGRFSLQHAMAEALLQRGLDRASFSESTLTDPRVNALADRIGYAVDARPVDRTKLSGDVEVRTRSGVSFRNRVEDMRGMPQNPLSTEDFVAKFRSNADGVLSAALTDRTIEAILNLESVEDVRTVFDPLCQ